MSQERHLLRAQIARISATCTLASKGWYEEDEEAPILHAIQGLQKGTLLGSKQGLQESVENRLGIFCES